MKDLIDKLIQEKLAREAQAKTRRHFIKSCAQGMGGLALSSIFMGCNPLTTSKKKAPLAFSERDLNPLATLSPPYSPKVKSVIYLHMAGAPSQLEMFDYKPELHKYHGQDCPQSLLEGKKFAFIKGTPKLMGPQAEFKQEGESGNWVSNFMPHFKNVVDEVAFLKAVHTDQFNHGPAQLFMHTGSARLGRPSIGAWATYGLGSENQNLPGFVVLTSGGNTPDAGKSVWGSGFLPSVYQGVQCRSEGDPVLYIEDPDGITRDLKKSTVDAINKINKEDKYIEQRREASVQNAKEDLESSKDRGDNIRIMFEKKLEYLSSTDFYSILPETMEGFLQYSLFDRFSNLLVYAINKKSSSDLDSLSSIANEHQMQYVINFQNVNIYEKNGIIKSDIIIQLFDNISNKIVLDKKYTGDFKNPGFEFTCQDSSIVCTFNNVIAQSLRDIIFVFSKTIK